jgi:predicted DNA-binding protein
MINNFEEYTFELTNEERFVVETIVKRFNNLRGKRNIATGEQIRTGIRNHLKIDFAESRIRKMIQYIRLNNLVMGLVATSRGYYVAESIEEIQQWVDSLISRENAIREIREKAERQIEEMKTQFTQTSLFK